MYHYSSSVQLLSHVRLCDPKDCSTPGFPVHNQPPELAQTHVHQVSDAIQPSHPRSSPSPPALNPSLSITNSQSSPELMFIESVMPSDHLILCHPLLPPPSIFPSISVFSNE